MQAQAAVLQVQTAVLRAPLQKWSTRRVLLCLLLLALATPSRCFDVDSWHDGHVDINADDSGSNSTIVVNVNKSLNRQAIIDSAARHGINLARYNNLVLAHAVMACLVWALIIPVGGMLLRINLSSPWVLKAHVGLQVSGLLAYAVSIGIGIHLIHVWDFEGSPIDWWDGTHPKLGLAILVLAFIQPFLGCAHHLMFKRRLAADGVGARTVFGHMHLWLGRFLILLGIINGITGWRFGNKYQTGSDHRNKGMIATGVLAGVVIALYITVTALYEVKEWKKAKASAVSSSSAPAMTQHTTSDGAFRAYAGDTPLPTYEECTRSTNSGGTARLSRANSGSTGRISMISGTGSGDSFMRSFRLP